jgi:hypothetical protein
VVLAVAVGGTVVGCAEDPEPAFLPEARRGRIEPPRRTETPPQAPRAEAARPAGDPPGAIPAPPDVSAPPADAERTPSGLATRVLQPGRGGARPGPTDRVTVHYTGWRAEDGSMFDSSVQRGEPATFPLNGVIRGWTEGLQLMTVGEKRRLWIPGNLAYDGRPGRPQGMLVFDVELLGIL